MDEDEGRGVGIDDVVVILGCRTAQEPIPSKLLRTLIIAI
jgi:hypothetical protein